MAVKVRKGQRRKYIIDQSTEFMMQLTGEGVQKTGLASGIEKLRQLVSGKKEV